MASPPTLHGGPEGKSAASGPGKQGSVHVWREWEFCCWLPVVQGAPDICRGCAVVACAWLALARMSPECSVLCRLRLIRRLRIRLTKRGSSSALPSDAGSRTICSCVCTNSFFMTLRRLLSYLGSVAAIQQKTGITCRLTYSTLNWASLLPVGLRLENAHGHLPALVSLQGDVEAGEVRKD